MGTFRRTRKLLTPIPFVSKLGFVYTFRNFIKRFSMPYNKEQLLTLPLEERKELANELIDSILADEMKPIPEWKKELLQERIKYHAENPGNGVEWNELKKRYGK